MKIPVDINWNGFLDVIISPSRAKQESCAWIFADIQNDVWNIWEVKNIGLRNHSLVGSFAPDKKEFAKTKRLARKCELTRIENVHTHVVVGNNRNKWDNSDLLENQLRPSEMDLAYARKFNDVVRGIIVVWFKDYRSKGQIYGIVWHDQYSNILKREKFI